MTINSRQKGARGERELCKWLMDNLPGVPELSRTLDQARDGGADIMLLPPFAIEVKRCQVIEIEKWWKQAEIQAEQTGRIPLLAYRANRKPWTFCLPCRCYLYCDMAGYFRLTESGFIGFYKNIAD